MLFQNAHQILAVRQHPPDTNLPLHPATGQQFARLGHGNTSAALVVCIGDGEDELAGKWCESPQAAVVPARDNALAIPGKHNPGGRKVLYNNSKEFFKFYCGPKADGFIGGGGEYQRKVSFQEKDFVICINSEIYFKLQTVSFTYFGNAISLTMSV